MTRGYWRFAEEKRLAAIQDSKAWPIPGRVVFAGEGITENRKPFLIFSGKQFSTRGNTFCKLAAHTKLNHEHRSRQPNALHLY